MTIHYYFAANAVAQVRSSWPWYLTRASGLVAAASLVLLMITGISAFTGHIFKFMEPLKAWANHRTIGIIFSVSVATHIFSLLFDKFIPFSIVQVLVPFASPYKHIKLFGLSIGSVGVTLGILALYMVIAIVYTSLTKTMESHNSLWKLIHYLSYAVIGLIFLHSIMIGTDFKRGLWRWLWIFANIVVLGFIGLRLRRSGSLAE